MVQKLQIECGHNTVNKIKTMISDMAKSGEIGNEFSEANGKNF